MIVPVLEQEESSDTQVQNGDQQRYQSQEGNPFGRQLPADPPVFSTVQPPSSSMMGEENFAGTTLQVDHHLTEEAIQEEQSDDAGHQRLEAREAPSQKSFPKNKSSAVLPQGPIQESNEDQHQKSAQIHWDRNRTQHSQLMHDYLPTSEQDESLYHQ